MGREAGLGEPTKPPRPGKEPFHVAIVDHGHGAAGNPQEKGVVDDVRMVRWIGIDLLDDVNPCIIPQGLRAC